MSKQKRVKEKNQRRHSVNSPKSPLSALIETVNSVVAVYPPIADRPRQLVVAAYGTTSTSGWSSAALSPHYDAQPPTDGVWEFDFVADPPPGFAIPVELPIAADGSFTTPAWTPPVTKVKVNAASGSITVDIVEKAQVDQSTLNRVSSPPVVFSQEIASYEDSDQPAGRCKGYSLRWKKLQHVLTLVVSGPDKDRIIACYQQVLAAGLIAAIASAYASGGAALSIDITALLDALRDCLGDLYDANVVDSSHWVYWCS